MIVKSPSAGAGPQLEQPAYEDVLNTLWEANAITEAEKQEFLENYRFFAERRDSYEKMYRGMWVAIVDGLLYKEPSFVGVKQALSDKAGEKARYAYIEQV